MVDIKETVIELLEKREVGGLIQLLDTLILPYMDVHVTSKEENMMLLGYIGSTPAILINILPHNIVEGEADPHCTLHLLYNSYIQTSWISPRRLDYYMKQIKDKPETSI